MGMPQTSDWTTDCGAWFTRAWSAGFLVLHVATWPLWGWGETAFPQLPFFPERLAGVLDFDFVLVGPMVVAALALLWKPERRTTWWYLILPLGLSVAFDQHRLQPWVYQTFLYGILLGCLSWVEARRWILAIAISVYLYSSLGKFDFQFVHTVGRDLSATLVSPLGEFSPDALTKIAFTLPLGELLIAILLAIPRTRRFGGGLAIGMHVTLIGLFGPWALNHSHGVLLWNVLLAIQAWLLFVQKADTGEQTTERPNFACIFFARGVALLALIAPLGERQGLWDHWTSWALYSPHNSRAEVQVHRSAVSKLPGESREFLIPTEDDDGWFTLDFESWSLAKRRVPIYPQARYQLGIAYQLALRHELGPAIRATRRGVSDRWTGERDETRAIGTAQLSGLR